ncbi:RNA polymerase I-specific transcription initiation factor RRN3, partial [Trifolium medium]|nr:RNA polymerase I-specific transcription initiation factor RRN3 [Trifolium medium]
MYAENMLRLESGAIGEIVGGIMLPALVDKLIEFDAYIGWDGKLQEDAKCIFEMDLEDIAEFEDDDEKHHSM